MARKYAYAFGLLCFFCLLQVLLALFGLFRIFRVSKQMAKRSLPAVQLPSEMRLDITQTRRADLALLLCVTESYAGSCSCKPR
jgi:hypothetical protein